MVAARKKHRQAAVYEQGDPRAEHSVRAVPEGASLRRVGSCVLGYDYDPLAYRRGWTPDRQRVAEIERVIRRRHGGPVDTDDGSIYLQLIFPHLSGGSARAWAVAMTPALTDEEFLEVAAVEPKRLDATEAGKRLALTIEEREALDIRTMRAVGQTDESMKAARRERHAAAARDKRAAQPRRPKLKDSRPWEAEGISYRTWRRRRADGRGQKNVSNKYETPSIADEKLATPKLCARPEGRAAKRNTLSAEKTAKLREISRSAAGVNQRASDAAVALARTMSVFQDSTTRSRFTANIRSAGSITAQGQPSIPVKINKNDRRAVA